MSPTIVTYRYKAQRRVVNQKSSTFVSASILFLSRLKPMVAQEWQDTIYKGTSIWYSLRSSSQQITAVNWQMRVSLPEFLCWESVVGTLIELGRIQWILHWNNCVILILSEPTQKLLRKQQTCYPHNHLWSGNNSGPGVRNYCFSNIDFFWGT